MKIDAFVTVVVLATVVAVVSGCGTVVYKHAADVTLNDPHGRLGPAP